MSGLVAREVRPECKVGIHHLCRPGPVITSYGDVALTIRCDCACHRRRRPPRETR